MARSLKIGVQVGSTIQVQGVGQSWDFLKPSVWAEIQFDDTPTEEELKEKWEWLWEKQVAPQADQIIGLMIEELKTRVEKPSREPSLDRPHVDESAFTGQYE